MVEKFKEMFHLYKKKNTFSTTLASGQIDPNSICFIEETKEIWTQDNFYNIDAETSNFIERVKTFLGDNYTGESTLSTIIQGIEAGTNDTLKNIKANVGDTKVSLSDISNVFLAPLNNSTKKIDSKYLPSYVDDVLEYNTREAFPATGEKGKVYVVTTGADINTVWRWSGSTYIKIVDVKEPPVTKKSLGLDKVNNTSDADKPISTKQQVALNKKVDKVSGKGLSTNDFTDEYKNKLDNYKEPTDYSDTIESLQTNINNLDKKLAWKIL